MAHLAQQLASNPNFRPGQQVRAEDGGGGQVMLTIPTSPHPPEIVTTRSKANEPTLASFLPRLTPAQREAAITLATRCGAPRTCLLHKTAARPNADLQLEWMATRVYVHPDGSVTGRTHVAHSSIAEVEAAIRDRIDITADLRPSWAK